jgi:predicted enzyme related to lactoylglutathione lyase
MSSMINGIGWFQIGAVDQDGAAKFYGELFGWNFADDRSAGPTYRIITTPVKESIQGGLYRAESPEQQSAMFCVEVADVEATCAAARSAGGIVVNGPDRTPDGLAFADLRDPSGNLFGVYAPPAS